MEDIVTKYAYNPSEVIYIPGTVYSSKNHKEIKWRIKKNKNVPFISNNKNVINYMNDMLPLYNSKRSKFKKLIKDIPLPIYLEFCFIMPTYGIWDFNNLTQLVCDMIQKANWLPGDDVNVLLPVPRLKRGYFYFVDKPNTGVILRPMVEI